MDKDIRLDLTDIGQTAVICGALSNKTRLEILRILSESPYTLSDLSKILKLPISTTGKYLDILEKAGLINTTILVEKRGAPKVCTLSFKSLSFVPQTANNQQTKSSVSKVMMPIGHYYDCQATPPCGIATNKKFVAMEDTPDVFYLPERVDAQLIWFKTGFVEYRFPVYRIKKENLISIKFSFEICSEAPGYRMDWPSDVTVWANDVKICTLRCTGDFGDRKGIRNPEWWADEGPTQYGELRNILITQTGCFADDIHASDATITSLGILNNPFISFRIGVEENSEYPGGLNLFGENFGDYRQNIVLTAMNYVEL